MDDNGGVAIEPTNIEISAGDVVVEVDPVNGGRVAQINVGHTPLLIGRSDVAADALSWGAYPMVPWAGRIRDGRFDFGGRTYQLPRNHGVHAMHGVGFVSPWSVIRRTPNHVELTLQLPTTDRWPFGGAVEQRITITEHTVSFSMTVTSRDQPFPVSFGWHPWFRKPSRLDFRPSAMYRRDSNHIAVDELVETPAGPWDDCFINDQPVRMTIDGIDVEITSPCTHWVVYDEPEHATCVEPQTGPPDAFNIRQHVLAPGTSLAADFLLRIERRPNGSSSP